MSGNDRLIEIFKIMSFYDDYRWQYFKNDTLINFFKDEIDDDTKILTHWLCYITDRQMPFQRVWDVGGFVFSNLIVEIKNEKNLELLKPGGECSFVQEKKDGTYTFRSYIKAGENKTLKKYSDIPENKKVEFKSRFLPSDYYSILCTFAILKEYEFSFSKLIKEVYEKNKEAYEKKKDKDEEARLKADEDNLIRRMLFSLYLLTYYDNKQVVYNNKKDTNKLQMSEFDGRIKKKINERNETVIFLLKNPGSEEFQKKYETFVSNEIFNQKRAWCSLRDYIKNPGIKKYFENALSKEGLIITEIEEEFFSNESLSQLELPGDVWNNNSEFRKCILKNTEYEYKVDKKNQKSKWSLNKILRDFYNKNKDKIIDGYPEQFDISFDFVPRMCESYKQNNCEWCPIHKIDNPDPKDNSFHKVCLKDTDMYCPIILAGCNYKCNCIGEKECKLLH